MKRKPQPNRKSRTTRAPIARSGKPRTAGARIAHIASADSRFESVRDLAHRIHALNQDALRIYAPMVEAILRSRSREPRRIEHTLDRLLDFCGYDPVLDLYRKLCRHYWDIDPAATASYVHAYRETWDFGPQE